MVWAFCQTHNGICVPVLSLPHCYVVIRGALYYKHHVVNTAAAQLIILLEYFAAARIVLCEKYEGLVLCNVTAYLGCL